MSRPDRTPRLVATDLDGTLLRADGSVSARTRAALASVEAAGALLVFVTGRPPRWMRPVADATGHRGLAICANGALLYDVAAERVVGSEAFDPDAALRVIRALQEALPEVTFAVERVDGLARETAYRPRLGAPEADVVAVEELVRDPFVKLLARVEGHAADALLARARDAVHDAVGPLATLTSSGMDGLVEISGAGVTKASALERLAAGHGIGPDGVVAFGDMPNDLPMLGWAGHAVAVANAHPEVLAVADEVTVTNDDDGVARVLERLFGQAAP